MAKQVDKAAMACNKPRRTPDHPTKSHVVKACYDGQERVIRFGEQGAATAGKPKAGESARMKAKRKSFKARHAKNIARGPSSPAYWANKVKWADGGKVEQLQDYPDPYAEMNLGERLLELGRGALNLGKYGIKAPSATWEHLDAPEVFARMLRERYPELGNQRVNRGALDAAINFAGGYDWAMRPEVSAEDARAMALQYQLRDYMKLGRKPSNEAADYAQNLAGVEQALADRAKKIRRDREGIAALAKRFAEQEAEQGRVLRKAAGGRVGYDPARVQSIVDRVNAQFMAEGGAVNDTTDYTQLNARILRALIKRYGSEEKAREVMRTTDGGELLKIMREEESGVAELANGGPVLPADRATGYKSPGAQPDDRLARFGSSFISSLPGAAKNVAGGYVDMLSALNTYLYQLEPAEQIALLKQLPAGIRNMLERGVESVKQLPEKVAAATPESAGQFGAQLTAEMLLDPLRGRGKGAPKAEIMKTPGGNWEAGSIERVVDKIKPRGPTNRDEALMLGGPWGRDVDTPEGQKRISENAAMSEWIDKKLKSYIKNDMATERDPVRLGIEQRLTRAQEEKAKADLRNAKLREKISAARAQGKNTTTAERQLEQDIADAEQNYKLNQVAASHMRLDPQTIAANRQPGDTLMTRRRMAGAPEENLATTDLSTFWEKRSDIALGIPKDAGDAVDPKFWLDLQEYDNFVQKNPWALKVPPNTKIYGIQPNSERALQLDHLRDELEFALYDRANLPPELRLTPEDLSKMNMDAAVAHVGKMNAWRERNKIAADLLKSRNAATVTFKEYPEAGLEWKELKMPGEDQGGRATLEEALGYEGDVMGHCVGGRGYCDKVTSGEGQIFSLRDAKGEPHVTIEVKPTNVSKAVGNLPDNERIALAQQVKKELFGDPETLLFNLSNADQDKFYDLIDKAYLEKYGPPPSEIIQIKGKGNRKPADKYIPFVQDFVRSGKWGQIKDFQNTDLTRVGDKFYTKDEIDALTEQTVRRGSEERGYADGGAVKMAAGGGMSYNAAAVDAIVNRLREKFNG